ncbi:MAG: hypothetical protein WC676_00755 [Candidatus Omnitrophota bacterium]
MSNFLLIACAIILAVVTLIISLFIFFPEKSKTKSQQRQKEPIVDSKHWETVIARLEKHIYSLKTEIGKLQQEQKNTLKDLAVEKAKTTKLQEKVLQEKEWLEKDQSAIQKKEKEASGFKDDLMKVQSELEAQHAVKLKLERELTELRKDLTRLTSENKELSLKSMRLESDVDHYKKEFLKQKHIADELVKKNDQTQWVAKTEYERLQTILKEKEKDIERLSRNQSSS